MFGDSPVVALERREEVQILVLSEEVLDFFGRKSFVCNQNAFLDLVVAHKASVGAGIDHVAREDLRTQRFLRFQIVGVEDGNLLAALYPSLS